MESQRNWKSFLLLDSPRERTGSLSYLPDLITLSSRQPFLTHGICHLSIPSRTSPASRDISMHEFCTRTTVSSQFEKSFFLSPRSITYFNQSLLIPRRKLFERDLKYYTYMHKSSIVFKNISFRGAFEFSRKKNRIARTSNNSKKKLRYILSWPKFPTTSPPFSPSRPRRRLERRSLWLIGTHCTWESQV